MRYWIGPFALLFICCSGSSTKKTNSQGIDAVPEDPKFVDFAPQASADGQKQVFLSRRDAGAYRVYVYNEAANPKLASLAQSLPLDGTADELATSLSNDGSWILTWRYGTEKSKLLLNSFDATQQVSWDIDLSSRLRELTLAPSGMKYLAYTERKDGVDTVHVRSFATLTAAPTAEADLIGEYGAQFAVSGSDIYVFTRKADTAGTVKVVYRKRLADGSWELQTDSVTLNLSEVTAPSAASAFGLLYAKSLDQSRLKGKLGTYVPPADNTDYQKNVGIVQEGEQFKAFGTALDFSPASYRTNQPLTLGNISATADGAYILFTGYDAWFCKTRAISHTLMLLVRTSDGASLPLIPARNTGTTPWTEVLSEPCSHYDQSPIPTPRDFDVKVGNGQILSVVNNKVTLIYESMQTTDREIRRLVFDVTDWAAKTYANPVFTDISANPTVTP